MGKYKVTTKIIEKETVERAYGFLGTNAIIQTKKQGRVFMQDAFGGIDSVAGSAVRWRHGIAIKILDGDTLASLGKSNSNYTTVLDIALNGYDKTRPVLRWSKAVFSAVAKIVDGHDVQPVL